MEMEDVASGEPGNSQLTGGENVETQTNASGIERNTVVESQKSEMELPVLKITNITNCLQAGKLEKTEIPDSDAVSDFSSPIKPASVNHCVTSSSPPKFKAAVRMQSNASGVGGEESVIEEVTSVAHDADGPVSALNSSPPLLEGFMSSPMNDSKKANAIGLAAAAVKQLDGLGIVDPTIAPNAVNNMSDDMQKAIAFINRKQLVTSLPELEIVRTGVEYTPTDSEEFMIKSSDLPIVETTQRIREAGDNRMEDDKVTSSLESGHEEQAHMVINLPNKDSQHFDEVWREIMGTQKVPDSDITQDASQATQVNGDFITPSSVLPEKLNEEASGLQITGIQARESLSVNGHAGLAIDRLELDIVKHDGPPYETTFDGNTVSKEREHLHDNSATSPRAGIDGTIVANREDAEEGEAPAVRREDEIDLSPPQFSQGGIAIAINLDSAATSHTASQTQSNDACLMPAELFAELVNFTQVSTATEPDSLKAVAAMDIDHDPKPNVHEEMPSDTFEPNLEDASDKEAADSLNELTTTSPTLILSKLDPIRPTYKSTAQDGDQLILKSPLQVEMPVTAELQPSELRTQTVVRPDKAKENEHQSACESSTQGGDAAIIIEVDKEATVPQQTYNYNLLPALDTPVDTTTALPSIPSAAPTTQKELEVFDSEDEPMSDVPPFEQEDRKNMNIEPSSDVTKSTPLFELATAGSKNADVEIREESFAADADIEMSDQGEDRQIRGQMMEATDSTQETAKKIPQEIGEPTNSNKRVIPDSDEDEDDIEEKTALPLTRYEPVESAAGLAQASHTSSTAPAQSGQQPDQVPSSSPSLDAALSPRQSKPIKTSNTSFKLPKLSKDKDKIRTSLSSSPMRPESVTSSVSRVGEVVQEADVPQVAGSNSENVVIAELKAMKITSLKARNAVLKAEIANKRAKLEEVTNTLKKPAAETVKTHIKLLHDYNEIRDVGQGLIGMIADNRGLRIGELYEEFGVDVTD